MLDSELNKTHGCFVFHDYDKKMGLHTTTNQINNEFEL